MERSIIISSSVLHELRKNVDILQKLHKEVGCSLDLLSRTLNSSVPDNFIPEQTPVSALAQSEIAPNVPVSSAFQNATVEDDETAMQATDDTLGLNNRSYNLNIGGCGIPNQKKRRMKGKRGRKPKTAIIAESNVRNTENIPVMIDRRFQGTRIKFDEYSDVSSDDLNDTNGESSTPSQDLKNGNQILKMTPSALHESSEQRCDSKYSKDSLTSVATLLADKSNSGHHKVSNLDENIQGLLASKEFPIVAHYDLKFENEIQKTKQSSDSANEKFSEPYNGGVNIKEPTTFRNTSTSSCLRSGSAKRSSDELDVVLCPKKSNKLSEQSEFHSSSETVPVASENSDKRREKQLNVIAPEMGQNSAPIDSNKDDDATIDAFFEPLVPFNFPSVFIESCKLSLMENRLAFESTQFDSALSLNIDEVYSTLTVLTSPTEGQIIIFKKWKCNTDYTPQISEPICAIVVSYNSKNGEVTLRILGGLEEFKIPLGKFSLDNEEEEMGNIVNLVWSKDVITPICIGKIKTDEESTEVSDSTPVVDNVAEKAQSDACLPPLTLYYHSNTKLVGYKLSLVQNHLVAESAQSGHKLSTSVGTLYSMSDILKSPKKGQIIIFKEWKCFADYEPQVSEPICGIILSYDKENDEVTLRILDGYEGLKTTSVDKEEEKLKYTAEVSFAWSEVINPICIGEIRNE